jgi:hypothetical protein
MKGISNKMQRNSTQVITSLKSQLGKLQRFEGLGTCGTPAAVTQAAHGIFKGWDSRMHRKRECGNQPPAAPDACEVREAQRYPAALAAAGGIPKSKVLLLPCNCQTAITSTIGRYRISTTSTSTSPGSTSTAVQELVAL